jgi:hypothetical protein
MPLGRVPVAPILDRLTGKVDLLRVVESAATLQTALKQPPSAMPAAYVVTARGGRPQAGASGGRLVQGVLHGLQLVLFVRNYARSDTGAGAAAEMDQLIAVCDAALLNWSPAEGFEPFVLAQTAGQDIPSSAGVLISQQLYQTKSRIQLDRNP